MNEHVENIFEIGMSHENIAFIDGGETTSINKVNGTSAIKEKSLPIIASEGINNFV